MANVTLEEVLNSDEPIYVVNNTRNRGRIMLSLVHPGTGRIESIYIPVTWIPICLTDMVPREMLKASLDFRDYVAKGILKLVPPEEARRILAQPEAKEELRRLYESRYAQEEESSVAEPETVSEEAVSPRVQDLLLRLESGSLTPKHALNKLRSLATSLSRADLSFLVANAPVESVRSWAEKELKKRAE